MITFIFIGCLMVLVCLLSLVLPLSRNNTSAPVSSGSHNIEIAREKLADFELQKSTGAISEAQYLKLSEDTKRVLMYEADSPEAPDLKHGNPLIISVSIAALVPILALTLYLALGSPEGLQLNPTASQPIAQTDQSSGQDSAQSIDRLLQDLEEKMLDNPDDAEGWALLGRSYMSIQRYAQAHNAYSNLRRILGDQPTVLLQLADAEVMLNGGAFNENSKTYVTLAYAAEPDNVQAVWMSAMLDTQEGNLPGAISKWEKLEVLLGGQPEQQTRIRNLLAQARSTLAESQSESLPTTQIGTDQTVAISETNPVSVSIEVSLSSDLPAAVQDDMLVYVYARAASGPPMPLAVKQLTVANLPTTVTLTENDAMIDGMTISRFPQIVLGARVSITGEPTAQTGDIQSLTPPLSLPLDSPVKLEIKDLVN